MNLSRYSWIVPLMALSLTGSQRRAPVIQAEARLVLVPVTVTDRAGRVITGLNEGHFELFDDQGTAREIVSLSTEPEPCSVTVVFDLSGSMRNEIQTSAAALKALLDALDPADEAALITFADRPAVRLNFTSGFDEIRRNLAQQRVGGGTALIDAVYLGLARNTIARNPRMALVVVSDGLDNRSRYTRRELTDRARESETQVFTIGVRAPPANAKEAYAHLAAVDLLEQLASETGGLHFGVRNAAELPRVMETIGATLRNRYVIGFTPDGRRDGKWRRLRVKVNPPHGSPRIRVSARPGYYDR